MHIKPFIEVSLTLSFHNALSLPMQHIHTVTTSNLLPAIIGTAPYGRRNPPTLSSTCLAELDYDSIIAERISARL